MGRLAFRRLKVLEEEVQKLEEEQHLGPARYISRTVDHGRTTSHLIGAFGSCDMYQCVYYF